MARPGYTLLAEHFSTDSQSIRECDYQPGRFSKPVYTFGDDYWAAGKTKPIDKDGLISGWGKIISSYDNKSILWKASPSKETV